MNPSLPTIEQLFDDADDAELVEAIAVAAGERRGGPSAVSLLTEHLHVCLVWESAGRVSNGGFECLFQSPELDLEERIAAFQAIGATEAVRHLRKAASVFPGGRPHQDVDARLAYLKTLSPKARRPLDKGGRPLYHDEILPLISDYVRSRKELFLSLRRSDTPPILPRTPRTEPPGSNATAEAVARWLIGLGGTVQFHEVKFPNGNREPIFRLDDLPRKRSTLAAFKLPSHRRDTDRSLQILATWSGASSIDDISLEECRVGKPGLETLVRFPRLTSLSLAASRITNGAMELVARLKRLRRLNLTGTQITDVGLRVIAGSPRLSSLFLRGTKVTDSGIKALARMTALSEMDVSRTRVGGQSLRFLRRLEILTIGGTGFKDRKLAFLPGLPALQELYVFGARLAPEAVRLIASRRRLHSLLLWDTGLAEGCLESLDGHPKLADLNLQGMPLSLRGAQALIRIPLLSELHIGDGKVSPEAKVLLRRWRPALRLP